MLKNAEIFLAVFLVLAGATFAGAAELHGAFTGTAGYDSLAGQISSDSEKPEGDSDVVLSSTLDLRLTDSAPYHLAYQFYKNWYQDQIELNLYGQTLRAGRVWTGGRHSYQLSGTINHYVWDGESYLQRTSITPTYVYLSGRKWMAVYIESEREYFRKNSDRTGSRLGVGIRAPVLVGKLNRSMEMEIWRASEDTNSVLYRHDETGVGISARHDVFKVIDTLSYGARIMWRQYDTTPARIQDRDDVRREYAVGMSRGVDDNVELRLDGRWIVNGSNIAAEDYSRAIYTFSVIREF